MYIIGEKVRFLENDAVILTCSGDEVLIYIDHNYIKWVDRDMLEAGAFG